MTMVTDQQFPTFSDSDFRGFLAGMKTADYIALDTESNGKDLRSGPGYTMGISIAFRLGTFPIFRAYFPIRHFDWNYDKERIAELKEVIENLDCIIFHNAKHDLVALENLDIHYRGKFYDTMLMAHLVNENYFSKALDWLSRDILNDHKDRSKEMDQFLKAFGWGMAPSWMVREYAEHDADLTLRLFEYFKPRFIAEISDEEWEYRQRFVRLIAKMEGRGIRVDTDLSKRELAKGERRMLEIMDELDANPASNDDLHRLLIEEMRLPVYVRTPNDKVSFNKKAMEKYEELLSTRKDTTAKLILEFRGWQKTCSSNYAAYLKLLSNDGRVRPNYKLHGTVTGRLSCADPNLQQIPRVSDKPWNGSLKKAFIPDEGYTLYEADYSQLELRLGAYYAKEEDLIQIFAEGRDVFTEMASTLGMERHDTKTLVYTIQYGGGINRISTVFAVDGTTASEIRENFFSSYPGFRIVARRASMVARNKGYVKLWSGRRRHFNDPQNDNFKAFNAIVQGGAADIVMRTMLRLEDAVDSDNCRMLLQVHDSVVFEIKSEMVEDYLPHIKAVMEDVKPDFGVKFAVEVKEWGT